MSTKRKIPEATVPIAGQGGAIGPEWFKSLLRDQHVGDPALSAGAGAAMALPATPAGYLTITVNGTPYLFPYYPLP